MKASWIVKGFANHYRIKILILLEKYSELSVGEISESINTDEKNTSQHLSKMAIAGLIIKRHDGTAVRHRLTERGKQALNFLKNVR